MGFIAPLAAAAGPLIGTVGGLLGGAGGAAGALSSLASAAVPGAAKAIAPISWSHLGSGLSALPKGAGILASSQPASLMQSVPIANRIGTAAGGMLKDLTGQAIRSQAQKMLFGDPNRVPPPPAQISRPSQPYVSSIDWNF